MKNLSTWVESDTASPSPGELVAIAIYQPSDRTVRVLPGAFLYVFEHWRTYKLLGHTGETVYINTHCDLDSWRFAVACRYENVDRLLTGCFLQSYVVKHLQP